MDSILLTPERPTLDARQLDALIALWLHDRNRRLSKKTFTGYAEKIKYFRDWWAATGETVNWQLTEELLVDFNCYLAEKSSRFGIPLGYNTRKDCLRRLRQCLLWAYKNGYVQKNYSHWVPGPEGSAPLRVATPLEQLRLLIQATDQSPYPTRDRALLAVLLGTGVRRAECASINIEDVRMNADGSGELQVDAKKVRQRETHRRLVAFDAPTGRYLRAYLDALLVTKGPLFASARSGKRLQPVGVYKVIKRLIITSGLGDQLQGPHDLRRNFTTYFNRHRRGDAHGQLLSKQLGHTTFRQTAGYSLQDVEDVRGALISPFALLEGGQR